ncbi:exodeoxyribonuclease VII large subunit [Patescibacteria group bacterium]|nr:exodeoxyribonuclease VII large subunit [Patescibacteria group bacterium]
MIFSVSQYITFLNETFRAIWDTKTVAIEGEITGYRVSQGQWVNFDMKDEEGLISCFTVTAKLPFRLEDGMRVRVCGIPRVYQKYGKLSFSVETLELVGEGALKKALAETRARLQAEGLFAEDRKRKLPRFPQRIALIASVESAAYGDFLRIVGERWGGLSIDVYPVIVQGDKAAPSMILALDQATKQSHPYDAVVVTRGGGSFEELMAFNDERLVRALYACPFPTLVGVGHERDSTLAEEVADVRGSTPTDCARRLVPDRLDVLYEVQMLEEGMMHALTQIVQRGVYLQERLLQSMGRWQERLAREAGQSLERIQRGADAWIATLRERLTAWMMLLQALDPERVLKRGYALVLDEQTQRPIVHAEELTGRSGVLLRLQDGTVRATLEGVAPLRAQQLPFFYVPKKTP